MKKAELKDMDVKDLQKEVLAQRKALFDLKLNSSSSVVKDNSQFKKIRARIAQALTYLKQKEKNN